jgi:hypothetical protein
VFTLPALSETYAVRLLALAPIKSILPSPFTAATAAVKKGAPGEEIIPKCQSEILVRRMTLAEQIEVSPGIFLRDILRAVIRHIIPAVHGLDPRPAVTVKPFLPNLRSPHVPFRFKHQGEQRWMLEGETAGLHQQAARELGACPCASARIPTSF